MQLSKVAVEHEMDFGGGGEKGGGGMKGGGFIWRSGRLLRRGSEGRYRLICRLAVGGRLLIFVHSCV